jgi:metal-responsive CopG/Arc/MetJ family transcriptional regulator
VSVAKVVVTIDEELLRELDRLVLGG